MAVQARRDITNLPFITGGQSYVREAETFAQDVGRATALAPYTVMAQNAVTRSWVPLTSVDPTLTPGIMRCGAIGCTPAALAAVSDGSFRVSVDGAAISLTGLDFRDCLSVLDQPGRMTTAAITATARTFAAVADGAFNVDVDGQTIQVTGLNFTDTVSTLDTKAAAVCGVNGANLVAWQAVTVANLGGVSVTVDGTVVTLDNLDFAGIAALGEVADVLNFAAAGRVIFTYDATANTFGYHSPTNGETSTLTALAAGGSAVDISAAGFLNGAAAVPVQGTGSDSWKTNICDTINAVARGRFRVEMNSSANQMVFISPTTGDQSAVSVLGAPAGGTDISGAGFLNGAAGTAVAGSGSDAWKGRMTDVINSAAAGRFTVTLDPDGNEVLFVSPTVGVQSAVSVLTAGLVGTDISGPGFLNGLTGVGTVTAGTGNNGENIPTGIYLGDSITAAELVAGNVVNRPVLVGGCCTVDEDQLVFEGGLTLNSVVVSEFCTIRSQLASRGIYCEDTENITNFEN